MRGLDRIVADLAAHFDDIQCCQRVGQCAHASGRRLGHTLVDQLFDGALETSRGDSRHELGQLIHDPRDALAHGGDLGGNIEFTGVVAEKPVNAIAQLTGRVEQHVQLHICMTQLRLRLDFFPQLTHAQHFTRNCIGACNAGGVRPGFFLRAHRKAGTHTVDHAAGHQHGNDLAGQTVPRHISAEARSQRCREITQQLLGQ